MARQPLGRQQDNTGPLNMLLRAGPLTDDGDRSRLGSDNNSRCVLDAPYGVLLMGIDAPH